MSSSGAFVLDETDYVWSALNYCTTKCQLHKRAHVHTHTAVEMKAESWHVDPNLHTTCKPMHKHIYGVCGSGPKHLFLFFPSLSAVQHPSRAISITRETSELKFHLTVTLLASSRHIRALHFLNNSTMFAFSVELSLFLFKKKFKVGRNLPYM